MLEKRLGNNFRWEPLVSQREIVRLETVYPIDKRVTRQLRSYFARRAFIKNLSSRATTWTLTSFPSLGWCRLGCAIRMVDKERARTKLSVTSCSVAGMKAQKETREEKCEENNREADGRVEVTGGKLVTLRGLITKPHGQWYRPNEMRPRVRMKLFLKCNTFDALALGNCERMTDNDMK